MAAPRQGQPAQARALFAPLGPTYDRVGAVLSLGQDPRWRRALVAALPPGGHVLDVATGTGLVAAELLRRGFTVTGVDQSAEMLSRFQLLPLWCRHASLKRQIGKQGTTAFIIACSVLVQLHPEELL